MGTIGWSLWGGQRDSNPYRLNHNQQCCRYTMPTMTAALSGSGTTSIRPASPLWGRRASALAPDSLPEHSATLKQPSRGLLGTLRAAPGTLQALSVPRITAADKRAYAKSPAWLPMSHSEGPGALAAR